VSDQNFYNTVKFANSVGICDVSLKEDHKNDRHINKERFRDKVRIFEKSSNLEIGKEIRKFKDYLKGLQVISDIDDETRFILSKTLSNMGINTCFTGLKNGSRFAIQQSYISLTFKNLANDFIVSSCKVIVDNKQD
jgi:predicted HNH restriction endonuclease